MDLQPFVYRDVPPCSPYATDHTTRIKLAEASSYQFNRRNIESPYYPLHHYILAEVARYDNLTTHTTGSLTVEWKETIQGPDVRIFDKAPHNMAPDAYDHPSIEEPYDPLHDAKVMYAVEGGDEDDITDDDDDGAWETSSSRSDMTTAAKLLYKKEGSPDLMVTHSRLSAMDVPSPLSQRPSAAAAAVEVYRKSKYKFLLHGGVKIHHRCPALIGEIKPGPSRRKSVYWPWQIDDASGDLFFYSKLVFTMHPYLSEIACYSASGMFWTWRLVKRGEFETEATEFDWEESRWADTTKALKASAVFCKKFPAPCVIGTTHSDKAYTEMREKYFHPLENDWQPKRIPKKD